MRAYLLYAEAAARDPKTVSYTLRREELAPAAKLLMQAGVEATNLSPDIKQAEADSSEEAPVNLLSAADLGQMETLAPPPHLIWHEANQSFSLQTDPKNALTAVASAYGVDLVFDAGFENKGGVRIAIDGADFKTAMDAVSLATNTFLFPVSSHTLFVANDTEAKRREFEPVISVTVPLPYSIDTKDVVEAANAVRGVLSLRSIGWNSTGHVVVIRDRIERVRAAQSLFTALLLPKAQVSVRVQLITLGTSTNYHYGLALQNSFPIIEALKIGSFQTAISTSASLASYLVFKAGSMFFGIGLMTNSLYATYSDSTSRALYDATVVVSDGQTANFHVGEKYPIPTAIYTGSSQTSGLGTLANPIGPVNLEDLGLVLKVAAHVTGEESVTLDIEAESKDLGSTVIESVPNIEQRLFKGNVRLRPDEWAVMAGLNSESRTTSRNGIAGLSSIPGINQLLSENTRSHDTSDILVLIKPNITILPMSSNISPQYLLGPQRGWRVLL